MDTYTVLAADGLDPTGQEVFAKAGQFELIIESGLDDAALQERLRQYT